MKNGVYKNNIDYSRKSPVFNIILVVFCIIFIISVVRSLTSAPSLSFTSFLNSFSDVPTLDINWSILDNTIGGSWGPFDFLRNFINTMSVIISAFVYICGLLINLFISLAWAIRFLFV